MPDPTRWSAAKRRTIEGPLGRLGFLLDDCFPPALYGPSWRRRQLAVSRDLSDEALLSLQDCRPIALPAPQDPEGDLADLPALLHDLLTPREARVINARFGLDTEAHTLAEVGESLGLTQGRIRQIEAKALTTLRPSRSVKLLAPLLSR